jgi:hypothetical protein
MRPGPRRGFVGRWRNRLGVHVQALGVADEHVHHPVWVADARYVGIEVLLSCAAPLHRSWAACSGRARTADDGTEGALVPA